MSGPLIMVFTFVFGLAFLMFWNKSRVKGKLLMLITRKDKSLLIKLCELKMDFVIFGDRAYDVYPDFVRLVKFPMGWPPWLQELVPCSLYDEEDAVPLDWVTIDKRLERAMELRAALDENWMRKLVHESAAEGGAGINWRRVIPIALMVLGVIGLISLLVITKGCGALGGGGA
jgi:hypothetical protein